MADEYSGTFYKGSRQQHSVTKLWRHTIQDDILHDNLKFSTLLQSAVSQFLSATNISLSTLFSDTPSLCSSLSIRQQVLRRYKQAKLYFCLYSFLYIFYNKIKDIFEK